MSQGCCNGFRKFIDIVSSCTNFPHIFGTRDKAYTRRTPGPTVSVKGLAAGYRSSSGTGCHSWQSLLLFILYPFMALPTQTSSVTAVPSTIFYQTYFAENCCRKPNVPCSFSWRFHVCHISTKRNCSHLYQNLPMKFDKCQSNCTELAMSTGLTRECWNSRPPSWRLFLMIWTKIIMQIAH